MKRLFVRSAILLLAATTLLACEKKVEAQEQKTPHRTDFAPEEFGVGRRHTPNMSCNREIDQLLDQIRVCINMKPEAECKGLQSSNNERIARLKNSRRCSR